MKYPLFHCFSLRAPTEDPFATKIILTESHARTTVAQFQDPTQEQWHFDHSDQGVHFRPLGRMVGSLPFGHLAIDVILTGLRLDHHDLRDTVPFHSGLE